MTSTANDYQPSEVELARRAFRRERKRKSTWVAIASTLGFAVIVGFGLVSTPGWSRVTESFFNVEIGIEAFPRIIEGLWLNIRVLFFTSISVVIVGMLFALLRTLRNPVFFPLRLFAHGYVDFFRGLPLIITLYLVGFGIPGLRLEWLGRIPVEVLGTVALTLTYSAYVSEVFRAGIESIHPSQRLAARSLGLSYGKSMRLVVLPQAIRRVVPPLLNDFVSLLKDTGLVSILGVTDAVRAAQINASRTFNYTPYVVSAILFLLITIPLTRYIDRVIRRSSAKQNSEGAI